MHFNYFFLAGGRPTKPHNAEIQKKLPKALAEHFLKRKLLIPDVVKGKDAEELLKLMGYKESNFKGSRKTMKERQKYLGQSTIITKAREDALKIAAR
jgi:predicted RNA binding protein YcfA (HicA-like mRNA interferase family)